jgi:hypothetical protein
MEMPFDQLPSGGDIARYYVRELSQRSQGAEGFDLWRDGADYCYIWRLSELDFDYEGAWLLEVRTNKDDVEFRDLLLVWQKEGRIECEWRNTPVKIFCPSDEMREYLRNGFAWFAKRSSEMLI